MFLFINNQNNGCFAINPIDNNAQLFCELVLSGTRDISDYTLLNQGWEALKSMGYFQPKFSGNWAWLIQKPTCPVVDLRLNHFLLNVEDAVLNGAFAPYVEEWDDGIRSKTNFSTGLLARVNELLD